MSAAISWGARLVLTWVGVVCLATAGCSSATGGSDAAGGPTPDGSVSASAPPPSTSPPQACPNPEGGGKCLGALTAGTTYTTEIMSPPLTYSVPEDGWFNYEDEPGNFLLVPPGNDLQGVNAGTSDFIGVYTSIAPTRFAALPSCDGVERVPGVGFTAAAMASWMRQQPELHVTRPRHVSVDALKGLVTDVRVRPGAKLPVCHVASATFSVFLLFSGTSPSSLDHGVIADMTMRLYLLDYDHGVLVIEIDDIDGASSTLKALSKVAEGITFRVP